MNADSDHFLPDDAPANPKGSDILGCVITHIVTLCLLFMLWEVMRYIDKPWGYIVLGACTMLYPCQLAFRLGCRLGSNQSQN